MRYAAWLLIVGAVFLSSCQRQPQFDFLIVNARIVDGTGNPWFFGDVGIRDDRIAAVGHLKGALARRTIEANGAVLSPGFIDMLGQSELVLLADPRAMSKISQGVTTEITGEGESIAPQNDRTRAELKPEADRYGIAVDWNDLNGYFDRLKQKGSAVNVGTFVGATQVREYVVGFDDRPATPAELDQMKQLVRTAMQQGALGLSSALVYAPAIYASTAELIGLAREAGSWGGIYITHIRNERDREMQALYEATDIAREAGLPVEVWHLKVAGKQNFGKMSEIVGLINRFRTDGIDITANMYPYTASAAGLSACIPAWAHDGGDAKMLQRLRDPASRARIRADLLNDRTEQENFYSGTGADGIMISDVHHPDLKPFEGALLSAIAKEWKKDPIDALMDLLVADSARTGAIYFSMSEPDIRIAMAQPWVSFDTDYNAVATDGILHSGKPHPRAYGTFARVLARYVRQENVLTLEEAVRKMTSLPAQRVGLTDRGLVKPGFYADLVLFNPAAVQDRATFADPHQYSAGIDLVIVNGQPVWDHGTFTGNLPGRPLRGPGYHRAP